MTNNTKILILNNSNNNELMDILQNSYSIYQSNNIVDFRNKIDIINNISLIAVHSDFFNDEYSSILINDYTSLCPIVAFGENKDEVINNCLANGCYDFIAKPFNDQLVTKRINSLIKFYQKEISNETIKRDTVTGLFTRESFVNHVRKVLDSNPQEKFDMICIDIKNFKLFNNNHGTVSGNNLLKFAAEKISLSFGNSDNVARLNGDIFIALIYRPFTYKDEFFLKGTNTINEFPSEQQFILNFGIYQIEDNSVEVSSMYDKAIIACNSIKDSYHNSHAFYKDTMLKDIENESFLSLSIKNAIEEKQFNVYFQPKYSLNTEKIAGAEALVRWLHPIKGFISPSEFIPYFEKNGFISELDYHIWDITCAQMKEWLDEGIDIVPISVNISRMDIYKDGLCDYLVYLTDKYQLDRKYLHLEITESAYAQDYNRIVAIVIKLRSLGFLIEMDDFGTGYSSLSYLSELPIDILKLDIKLIESLDTEDGQSIINFIRELAIMMNVSIIAEGVENSNQIKKLKRFKCDYVQGFYYSKPLKPNEFKKQLMIPDLVCKSIIDSKENDEIEIIDNVNSNESILLIGDNKNCLKELTGILKNTYNLFLCNNLAEAKDFITREKNNISAVIIKFGKYEDRYWNIIESMNNNIEFFNLPIIVTTKFDNFIVKHSFQIGVKDVFVEPLIPISVTKRLENIVNSNNFVDTSVENINLIKFAYQDYLTKLSNRRGFERKFNKLILSELPINCSLFMIDIDDFSKIHDVHGHDSGDKILVDFATILKSNFRGVDILARLSADQFIAVMTGDYNKNIIKLKADTIIQQVHNLNITCSAGVVIFNSKKISKVDLVRKVDNALAEAKASGKNCCRIVNF